MNVTKNIALQDIKSGEYLMAIPYDEKENIGVIPFRKILLKHLQYNTTFKSACVDTKKG